VALPAFVVARRAAAAPTVQQLIDISYSATAANPQHAAAAGKWDRQTDGRTDAEPLYTVDAAPHVFSASNVHFIECRGTEDGEKDEFASQPQRRLPFYRDLYENCTTVKRNLEIAHLYPDDSGSDFDLSFLENIREVIRGVAN